MKNSISQYCFCLIFTIFSTKCISQTPQPPIKLTLGNYKALVEGSVDATGKVEGNSLKARGLATGNPFVIYPIYSNSDGDLITGYKEDYLSLPPASFHLSWQLNTNGTTSVAGPDFVIKTATYLEISTVSEFRSLMAPVILPHKHKLANIKYSFRAYDNKTITVSIIRSDGTVIFSHTSANALNGNTWMYENTPINLLQIDNSNYAYTLQITTSDNNWEFVRLGSVIIEHRDI
jgi:hypothetical protein